MDGFVLITMYTTDKLACDILEMVLLPVTVIIFFFSFTVLLSLMIFFILRSLVQALLLGCLDTPGDLQ